MVGGFDQVLSLERSDISVEAKFQPLSLKYEQRKKPPCGVCNAARNMNQVLDGGIEPVVFTIRRMGSW